MKLLHYPSICWLIGIGLASNAAAGPLRIVTTGDSLTWGYTPYLQALVADKKVDVLSANWPGATSARYVGLEANPENGEIRDIAREVIDLRPDVIVFLLGTNDAFQYRFGEYTHNVSAVYDRFAQWNMGEGRAPALVVLTVPPAVQSPARPDIDSNLAEQQITVLFNPWIEAQSLVRNWYALIQTHDLVTSLPNWQSLYKDHVHLLPGGNALLAAAVWDAVRNYPLLGDANRDYSVDNLDIAAFAAAITSPANTDLARLDINHDGLLNNLDIAGFTAMLAGATIAVPEPAAVWLAAGCWWLALSAAWWRRTIRRSRSPRVVGGR